MSNLCVYSFSISIDGYGAGPRQSRDNPLGVGGMALHQWAFATRTFCEMHGREGGTGGIDDDFARRGFENVGAWILGRNMFGPVRGPWPDDTWKGWWGDTPPYHTEVFVLTHHPRQSIAMTGGTTFHFVTDGIRAALERAAAAAGGKDIRLGGGGATIRQFLQAGLIDHMHLAVSPVLLGSGENLLAGIDVPRLGFEVAEHVASPNATHIVLNKRNNPSSREDRPGSGGRRRVQRPRVRLPLPASHCERRALRIACLHDPDAARDFRGTIEHPVEFRSGFGALRR